MCSGFIMDFGVQFSPSFLMSGIIVRALFKTTNARPFKMKLNVSYIQSISSEMHVVPEAL